MAAFQTLRAQQQLNGWTDAQVAELACRYVDKLGSSPSAFQSFISQSTPVEVSTGAISRGKSKNDLVAELTIQLIVSTMTPKENIIQRLKRYIFGTKVSAFEMLDVSSAINGAEQVVDQIFEARHE